MKSERLMNSGKFGQYRTPDDFVTDDVVAYEYCPELNYVMTTGGHGYAFAYDLETLEEIFVNPSTLSILRRVAIALEHLTSKQERRFIWR